MSTRTSPARKVTPRMSRCPLRESESRTLSDARAVSEREYPEIAEAPVPRGKCVHRVRIASARAAKGDTHRRREQRGDDECVRAYARAPPPRRRAAASRQTAWQLWDLFICARVRVRAAQPRMRGCSLGRAQGAASASTRTSEYSRAIGRAIVEEGSSLCAHACCRRPLISYMRACQCRLTITVSRILNYNATREIGESITG